MMEVSDETITAYRALKQEEIDLAAKLYPETGKPPSNANAWTSSTENQIVCALFFS